MTKIKLRVDFPTRIPFYVEPNFTINKWNFFNSSTQFVTDVKPPFLIQNETYLNINIVFPLGNQAKLLFGNNYATLKNEYYQSFKNAETLCNSLIYISFSRFIKSATLSGRHSGIQKTGFDLFSLKQCHPIYWQFFFHKLG